MSIFRQYTRLELVVSAAVTIVLGAPLWACGPNGTTSDKDSQQTSAVTAAPVFPLSAAANGRYFVDHNGTPFRVQGEASWDAHINLGLADLRTYLDDRKAKGFNALFTYVANPVPYYTGSAAPWVVQLGGAGVQAALPFTQNVSGGVWNGDPNFSAHDASFAAPNDAYFAWVAQFVDEAAARGMVVMLAPMYLGYGLGVTDGWYQTLMQPANNQGVCFAYGEYLANGHGTFTGFKNRPNIIWIDGGDMLPANGSEGALRALQVLKGLQAGGDTHPQSSHWQHDDSPSDQADFAPFLTANAVYTHGQYPTNGPTYGASRAIYSSAPPRPTFLLETKYWGDGAIRAEVREFSWGSALGSIGGVTLGFSPFWGFVTSADGSTSEGHRTTTAWLAGTAFAINQYISKGGNWYRASTAGTSGSTGPSGTGTAIADGSVVWTYAATGGVLSLLNDPAVLDYQRMGGLLDSVAWYNLVPSGLAGMKTVITAGAGTYTEWTEGASGSEFGGMDWIVSAASPDGRLLVAYVPDAHSGAFSVDMTVLSATSRARWYDPTSAVYTTIGNFPDTGTRSFSVPGANSAGTNDWVLVLDPAAAPPVPVPALKTAGLVALFVLLSAAGSGAHVPRRTGRSSRALRR